MLNVVVKNEPLIPAKTNVSVAMIESTGNVHQPVCFFSGMFGVNTSLIRFWENEFDVLEPRKNRKGDRFFKPTDVKNLQLIYDLLRRRKFTIEGAKEYLKDSVLFFYHDQHLTK